MCIRDRWMGSQPFLQVNAKGERFANESLPYDYDLHQAACQPGTVMVLSLIHI